MVCSEEQREALLAKGVEKVIELKLSEEEKNSFQNSVSAVKDLVKNLDL